jgi:hypothetical protein
MSLAKISKGVTTLGIVLGMCAAVLMFLALTDIASARPHGITGGYIKCHGKSKHHGRCHHKKRHHKRRPKPRPAAIPIKTGPSCDPRVFATPPNPKECEWAVADADDSGLENLTPPSQQTLEIKNMEVFRAVGFKQPDMTYGCADIYGTDFDGIDFGPEGDEYTITFVAEYGSFESKVTGGGSKYESSPTFCDRYKKPCPEQMSSDGYDEAWLLVYDKTQNIYAESEHVKFNIEEPENIRYPVG